MWEAGTWRFPLAHELGHWLIRVLQITKAPRAVAVSKAGLVEWWAETEAFGARVRAGRAVPEGSAAAGLHEARRVGVADAWDAQVKGSAARSGGGTWW